MHETDGTRVHKLEMYLKLGRGRLESDGRLLKGFKSVYSNVQQPNCTGNCMSLPRGGCCGVACVGMDFTTSTQKNCYVLWNRIFLCGFLLWDVRFCKLCWGQNLWVFARLKEPPLDCKRALMMNECSKAVWPPTECVGLW